MTNEELCRGGEWPLLLLLLSLLSHTRARYSSISPSSALVQHTTPAAPQHHRQHVVATMKRIQSSPEMDPDTEQNKNIQWVHGVGLMLFYLFLCFAGRWLVGLFVGVGLSWTLLNVVHSIVRWIGWCRWWWCCRARDEREFSDFVAPLLCRCDLNAAHERERRRYLLTCTCSYHHD